MILKLSCQKILVKIFEPLKNHYWITETNKGQNRVVHWPHGPFIVPWSLIPEGSPVGWVILSPCNTWVDEFIFMRILRRLTGDGGFSYRLGVTNSTCSGFLTSLFPFFFVDSSLLTLVEFLSSEVCCSAILFISQHFFSSKDSLLLSERNCYF